MYIIRIILDGFKSYATRTEISGFDDKFNAITGYNGSGKSNVLDSICFVLGITNLSQVRVSSLTELIYKQGQAGVTKASVTLVFDNTDASMSPLGYEQFSQIAVTRQEASRLGLFTHEEALAEAMAFLLDSACEHDIQIVVGGRNKYLINGHNANPQRVQNLFHSVQLNVNNPHFLIMQGRITKVLNNKPIETLGMIEEAAGTRMFETRKQQAIKTIEKKEAKRAEIQQVVDTDLTPRLEKLGAERAQYLEYTTLSNELEGLNRFCQAHDFYCAEQAKQQCVDTQSEDDSRKKQLNADIKSAETELSRLKESVNEVLARKDKEGAGELKALEAKEQDLSKQLIKLTTELQQMRDALQAEVDAHRSCVDSIAEYERSQKKCEGDKQKTSAAAEKAFAAHAKENDLLQAKRGQVEAEMGLGTTSDGEGSKNLQAQLSDASSAVSACATALKALEMKTKHVSKELKEVEKKHSESRKATGKQEEEQAALEKQVGKLRQQLQEINFDERSELDLGQEQDARQREHAQLCKREESLASSLSGQDFRYSDPEKGFDSRRVKGTVASNIRVQDFVNAPALEAVAGGRLHQVIVDDEKTGMLLLTKGKLQRRVTLIPLNKIRPFVVSPEKVAAAKKLVGERKVSLAVDLLEFAEEVTPAIQHIFGSTLVCSDKASARAVCEKIGVKSVTLEGDLYDPSGTLTGGSRAKGSASLLCRLSELSQLRKELADKEQDLALLAVNLEKCRKQAEIYQNVQSDLELKQHQLELHRQSMRSSQSGQLAEHLEKLRSQFEQQQQQLQEAKAALEDATNKREDLASQLQDFEGNREERMAQSMSAIAALEKQVKASAKAMEAAKQAHQKVVLEQEELEREANVAREQLAEIDRRKIELISAVESKEAAELAKKTEYEKAATALQDRKRSLGSYDEEVTKLSARRDECTKQKEDAHMELRQIEIRSGRAQKDIAAAEARCRDLLKQHPWITSEKDSFGQAGSAYDFKRTKPTTAQQSLAKKTAQLEAMSKRINKKVLSMFETAEQEYKELIEKKEIVEKDKTKIEAVIAELTQKKIEALHKTWVKVNKDFGSIFSTLLPGAKAKLEPQEGCSPEEGLIIKVGFGQAWKQGLQELSGGQRSLIALSLILSLLRFKPAPVYILDEVDAALDLSHTQNIGTMIKAHFKQSQFLVVSLKEGMFNNANVIFRTALVDGSSTITRSVGPGAKSRAEEPANGKKGAAAGRAALTAVNSAA